MATRTPKDRAHPARRRRSAGPRPPHGRDDVAALLEGRHATPHDFLGAHATGLDDDPGVIVRCFEPGAEQATLLFGAERVDMERTDAAGVFVAELPEVTLPLRYRLSFSNAGGASWQREDPYRFLPTVGELDLYLFNEGTHQELERALGARCVTHDGVEGVAFAVWAPNARAVSVVGDFCHWDGRRLPMRSLGASGVYELFVPGVQAGALYKYEVLGADGARRTKADPMARAAELPPQTASRVARTTFEWQDHAWMTARAERDITREPMLVYEVHLGSWMRIPEEGNRAASYRELAERLVPHVKRLGFTHIELMPVAEHPFGGSWGYQVTSYFAPTARHGDPDGLRYLVDSCHREGIGVIVDWVPAHFPKDEFALARFDGTALYEHEDPRRGEHPDWGTLIFNFGRREVKSFLISNATYWLREFHIDGLRVDAVASLLYLDYSRKPGEWEPNVHGGRENLEAIDLLRGMNLAVSSTQPGCFTVAEESTAFPGVTRPVSEGGLGFTFKWNMGWMHDTLRYLGREPIHRRYHHDDVTFAMLYEYSERFVMPLSHDEVVHGKGALLNKFPGDEWQRLATLRLLLAYLYTRPGKKLLFMGTELAPRQEWSHDRSLDWHLLEEPSRRALDHYMQTLGALYRTTPALYEEDHTPHGFQWLAADDRDNSVLSYMRRAGGAHVLVVLNMTPVPRHDYRVGAPTPGAWLERLSSDHRAFGGSDQPTPLRVETEPTPMHGQAQCLRLSLPPLGALVLTQA